MRLQPHNKIIVRFGRAITCMNPTENPRDNVIVRIWAHYNIVARIYPCMPHNHLLLESVPNLGLLISCWELNKCENC